MEENEYIARNDFIGLSTEEKPTKVVTGSTYYEVDTGEFFIYYVNQWYEQY